MTTTSCMMDVPLTIELVLDRAERWMGGCEVVSRRPDRSLSRTTYGAIAGRARKLARALVAAGIRKGDRVATLMWNHAEHLEAYFGIPLAGAVTHTLNLRLHPDEIAFIANDARDRYLIVDDVLLPLYEKVVASGARFERVLVVGAHGTHESYEALLETATEQTTLPALAETDALGVCYTSGTTGKPKGVVYSHRSTILHTLVAALPDALGVTRADTLLPVVPMFHVNAWGLPFIAAMSGTRLVFPGPHLDPPSLLDLMAQERVTIAAGVPTIWLGIREALDGSPGKWQLQPGLRMVVGGSAAPEQLIRDFDRLGMTLIHAWGMTETSPIGLVSRVPAHLADADEAVRYRLRAKQGVPPPLVDVCVRNEAGDVPADDRTSGELLVKGPWVAGRYANDATPERWTADGWFRTGDVARVDEHGFVQLTDRVADLIKSGGEWIASQELENALMGHPAVKEAAVIGVAHPKWSERPLAAVVLKAGAQATAAELCAHLAPTFPKFWLPDSVVFVDAIPRTSAGKFKKTELRETYRDHYAKA
ncbi:MAG: long-chain fatty acid--CoA ligase [Deltaproteobacteria bacterium]|nr:long-chain fatty acid--CoA ligase [Deltaproteobacteria bacterium]MDQ3296780.1 long-chain fatty acid--CoA ligase [Myxococcota bacterium]